MKVINYKRHGLNMNIDMFINAYRIVILCFLVLTFSCTKEDGEGVGPSISFINDVGLISSDTSISPGQLMKFGVNARKGDFDITQLLVRVKGETVQDWFDSGMYTPQLKWYGSFSKSYSDNEIWEFIVRDRYGNQQMTSIVIQNDSVGGPGPIDYFQDIVMGAQNNLEKGGFLNLKNNLLYFQQDAFQNQELIDMIYYLGEDEHTLGSPGANIEDGIFDPVYAPSGWEVQNTSRYIPLDISVEEFDQIENDSVLLVSYIEGEGKRKAKNLQGNNIFSFKTQDLRFGMLKVNEVIGNAEGTVSIDVKIQQEKIQ